MGRKKKLINNTNIPQYAIERFARCVFDDIRAAYENEEIQKEFAEWQAEQAAKKVELKLHKKARATNETVALARFISAFSFLSVLVVWIRVVSSSHSQNMFARTLRNKQ